MGAERIFFRTLITELIKASQGFLRGQTWLRWNTCVILCVGSGVITKNYWKPECPQGAGAASKVD